MKLKSMDLSNKIIGKNQWLNVTEWFGYEMKGSPWSFAYKEPTSSRDNPI